MNQQVIAGCNCIVALPDDYSTTKTNYPLIIVLNGAGAVDYKSAISEGLLKQVAANGTTLGGTKFIVIGFSDHGYGWPMLDGVISAAIAQYRVSSVIITGLSQGATDAVKFMLRLGTPSTLSASKYLLLSTPGQSNITDSLFQQFGKSINAWFITGDSDPIAPAPISQSLVDGINKYGGLAKLTIFPGGHSAQVWDAAYTNANVYAWLSNTVPSTPTTQSIPVTSPKTIIGTTTKSLIITSYSDGSADATIK